MDQAICIPSTPSSASAPAVASLAPHRLGRLVAFVSGRGGVGLSVSCAGASLELASRGHLVLAVDLAVGLGGLDRLLGVPGSPGFALPDVVAGRVGVTRAAAFHPRVRNLAHLAAGVAGPDPISGGDVVGVLADAVGWFDFVVVDVPHGWNPVTHACVVLSSDVVMVGGSGASARRSSDDLAAAIGYVGDRRCCHVRGWGGDASGAARSQPAVVGYPTIAAMPDLSPTLVRHRARRDGVPLHGSRWRSAFASVAGWIEDGVSVI